jgi:hypothetical protein
MMLYPRNTFKTKLSRIMYEITGCNCGGWEGYCLVTHDAVKINPHPPCLQLHRTEEKSFYPATF